jgi:hypothetical protein
MADPLEGHLQRQVANSEHFFWHRLRWRAVRGYLPVGRPFELVDVGAGAGLLATFLARDRPLGHYRFIEPIESLHAMLVSRHGQAADASEVATFDLVAKMEPGSILLLTVPAMPSLWSQWDVALGHFRRYEKDSLRKVFADLPTRTIETSYLFPEMVPPGYLRSRREPPGSVVDLEVDAEFPDLPRPVNDCLYGLGTISLSLRKHWGFGSSLFMAVEVTG